MNLAFVCFVGKYLKNTERILLMNLAFVKFVGKLNNILVIEREREDG